MGTPAFGRKTGYGLVLASWITVLLALVPLLLDYRMDGPNGLGLLVVLGAVVPVVAMPCVLLLSALAKYLAIKNPGRWRGPGWKPMAGALAAAVAGPLVTLPMLMSSRAPVRVTVSRANVNQVVGALAGAWDGAREEHGAPEAMQTVLGAALARECAHWRNPFTPERRAFDPVLHRPEGLDAPAIGPAMEALAQETGCVVAAYQMPQGKTPGFVAAAVRFPGREHRDAWDVKWTPVE